MEAFIWTQVFQNSKDKSMQMTASTPHDERTMFTKVRILFCRNANRHYKIQIPRDGGKVWSGM